MGLRSLVNSRGCSRSSREGGLKVEVKGNSGITVTGCERGRRECAQSMPYLCPYLFSFTSLIDLCQLSPERTD
uniref:Uncharacterized protein n=1 Tax=Setaria italica TaxID=4555 RepID=K4AHL4_SETIT